MRHGLNSLKGVGYVGDCIGSIIGLIKEVTSIWASWFRLFLGVQGSESRPEVLEFRI